MRLAVVNSRATPMLFLTRENRCSAWSKFVDHEQELQAVHQLELVGATPNIQPP
jgi:hypothetical protein